MTMHFVLIWCALCSILDTRISAQQCNDRVQHCTSDSTSPSTRHSAHHYTGDKTESAEAGTASDENSFCTMKAEAGDEDNSHCSNSYKTPDIEKQKYQNPRWQKFYDLISKAEMEYKGCERDTDTDCTTCHNNVIAQDLAPFKQGISAKMMETASSISRVTKYQVINHKLYRSENCMFPFRCKGVEHFLKKLLPELDDTEFYLNTRDWPMAGKFQTREPVPVLSFSKTQDYWDIMYPAWTFWEGGPALEIYPTGLGRWDKYIKTLTAEAKKHPWKSKSEKGFFRGSRTSSERDPLILLSRDHPDILDAQYTKNQAWKSAKDTLGAQPAKELPLEEHCKYKYLFNYRGVAASFRFKHLFLCGSLVLHVGDEWQEFFYPALTPWLHYVPLPASADQQQILEVLEFLRENDGLAAKIARQGYEFVRDHLKFQDISCYWRQLLSSYTKLLSYQVNKDHSLFQI